MTTIYPNYPVHFHQEVLNPIIQMTSMLSPLSAPGNNGRWAKGLTARSGLAQASPLTTETSTPDLINPALRQHTFHRESPTIVKGKCCRLRSHQPLRLSSVSCTLSVEGKSLPVNKPDPAVRHRLTEGLLSTTVRRYQRKQMGL